MPRLAAFVSPHGFGHAARTAASLEALGRIVPGLELELWTTVPEWFFAGSLSIPFRYRLWRCDVGLIQTGPVTEDLAATVAALEQVWEETHGARAAGLVSELQRSGATAVLCDISPFGLELARAAGLPSILLENFTWDWIYAGYLAAEPRLAAWIERLHPCFAGATLHIQAEPVCAPAAGARRVPPIARGPRQGAEAVRQRLGIRAGRRMALVSMGGVFSPSSFANVDRWRVPEGVDFVVPGGAEREERRGDLVLLPHRTPVHHPDLVAAADVVVGKLGYSTVAEAHAAGTRMAYLPRPAFRESAVLERFVTERLPCVALDTAEFENGTWAGRLPELLARPRPAPGGATGAAMAAEAIAELLLATRSQ